MKVLRSSIVLAVTLALGACSGGGGTVLPAGNGNAASSPQSFQRIAPGTTFSARSPQNSIGGIPSFQMDITLFDAVLNAQSGSRLDLALTGVNVAKNDGTVTPVYRFPFPVIVDILQLIDSGVTFSADVPVQNYASLQLVVIPAYSSVVTNGHRYAAQFGSTPASSTAPLTISAPVSIHSAANGAVTTAVDFNALESVQLSGSTAIITPFLVAATSPATITGRVVNKAGTPVAGAAVSVTTPDGKQLENVGLTAADGTFAVHAIAQGVYQVQILNSYTSRSGNVIEASGADPGASPSTQIHVTSSSTVDLGTLVD